MYSTSQMSCVGTERAARVLGRTAGSEGSASDGLHPFEENRRADESGRA